MHFQFGALPQTASLTTRAVSHPTEALPSLDALTPDPTLACHLFLTTALLCFQLPVPLCCVTSVFSLAPGLSCFFARGIKASVCPRTWPVSDALMRKYVDSSMGLRTPLGTNTNEPSENTAELRAAKKLSPTGTCRQGQYCVGKMEKEQNTLIQWFLYLYKFEEADKLKMALHLNRSNCNGHEEAECWSLQLPSPMTNGSYDSFEKPRC